MILAPIDWPLILEFTKALSGPLATVAVIGIAANFGRRTFLKRTVTEMRLRWYRRMHRRTALTSYELMCAKEAHPVDRIALVANYKAHSAILALAQHEALMFAGRKGVNAMAEFNSAQCAAEAPIAADDWDSPLITDAIISGMELSVVLANEARRELGIQRLKIDHDPLDTPLGGPTWLMRRLFARAGRSPTTRPLAVGRE